MANTLNRNILTDPTQAAELLAHEVPTPTVTETKQQTLLDATKNKVDLLDYQPKILDYVVDRDTVRFQGDTRNTRIANFNTTGTDSFGVDAYETVHDAEWNAKPANIARMQKQRELISIREGIPLDQVTNEMVNSRGLDEAIGTVKDLNTDAAGNQKRDLLSLDNPQGNILRDLNIPVEAYVNKNVNPSDESSTNNYGRDTGMVRNPDTGYELGKIVEAGDSRMDAATRAQRIAEIAKPNNSYLGNMAKAAASEAVEFVAGTADVAGDLTAAAIQKGVEALGGKVTADDVVMLSNAGFGIDETTGKLEHKWFNNAREAAEELTGYDSQMHTAATKQFTNTIENISNNKKMTTLEKIAAISKAAWEAKETVPEAVIKSLAYLAHIGNPVTFGMTVAKEANEAFDERNKIAVAKSKESGEPVKFDDLKDKAITTGITAAKVGLDKVLDKVIFSGKSVTGTLKNKIFGIAEKATKPQVKGMVKAALQKTLKAGAVAAESGTTEYFTEGMQTAMEIYAKKFDGDMLMDGELQAEFTDKEWKEIKAGAAVGALTGTGQSVAGQAASDVIKGGVTRVKENAVSKLIGQTMKLAATKQEIERTKENMAELQQQSEDTQKSTSNIINGTAKNSELDDFGKKDTATVVQENLQRYKNATGFDSHATDVHFTTKAILDALPDAGHSPTKETIQNIKELLASPELKGKINEKAITDKMTSGLVVAQAQAIADELAEAGGAGLSMERQTELRAAIEHDFNTLNSFFDDIDNDEVSKYWEENLEKSKKALQAYVSQPGGKTTAQVAEEIFDTGFIPVTGKGETSAKSLPQHEYAVMSDVYNEAKPAEGIKSIGALAHFVRTRKVYKGYLTPHQLGVKAKEIDTFIEMIDTMIADTTKNTTKGTRQDGIVKRLEGIKAALNEAKESNIEFSEAHPDEEHPKTASKSTSTPTGSTGYSSSGSSSGTGKKTYTKSMEAHDEAVKSTKGRVTGDNGVNTFSDKEGKLSTVSGLFDKAFHSWDITYNTKGTPTYVPMQMAMMISKRFNDLGLAINGVDAKITTLENGRKAFMFDGVLVIQSGTNETKSRSNTFGSVKGYDVSNPHPDAPKVTAKDLAQIEANGDFKRVIFKVTGGKKVTPKITAEMFGETEETTETPTTEESATETTIEDTSVSSEGLFPTSDVEETSSIVPVGERTVSELGTEQKKIIKAVDVKSEVDERSVYSFFSTPLLGMHNTAKKLLDGMPKKVSQLLLNLKDSKYSLDKQLKYVRDMVQDRRMIESIEGNAVATVGKKDGTSLDVGGFTVDTATGVVTPLAEVGKGGFTPLSYIASGTTTNPNKPNGIVFTFTDTTKEIIAMNALAAYTEAQSLQYRDADDILKVFGLNPNSGDSDTNAEALFLVSQGKIPFHYLVATTGANIISQLGITTKGNIDKTTQEQLEKAVGLLALSTLITGNLMQYSGREVVGGKEVEMYTVNGYGNNATEVEANTEALNEALTIFKYLDPSTRGNVPSAEKITKVSDTVRNDIEDMPKQAQEGIKAMQEKPLKFSALAKSLLTVTDDEELNSKHRQSLREIAGWESIEGLHANKVTAQLSINNQIERDIDNMYMFNLMFGDSDMYVNYDMTKSFRFMIDNELNPQASKISRFMTGFEDMQNGELGNGAWTKFDKKTGMPTDSNFKVFLLAISQGLDLDPDKLSDESAYAGVLKFLDFRDTGIAIKMKHPKGSKDEKMAKAMAKALKHYRGLDTHKDISNLIDIADLGEHYHAVQAMFEISRLSAHIKSKSKEPFKHELMIESDGITSGMALTLMQIGSEWAMKILAKTGVYTAETAKVWQGRVDAYNKLKDTHLTLDHGSLYELGQWQIDNREEWRTMLAKEKGIVAKDVTDEMLDAETFADIYRTVGNGANTQLQKILKGVDEEYSEDTEEYHEDWKFPKTVPMLIQTLHAVKGDMNRKLAKPPTMVYIYGAKMRSIMAKLGWSIGAESLYDLIGKKGMSKVYASPLINFIDNDVLDKLEHKDVSKAHKIHSPKSKPGYKRDGKYTAGFNRGKVRYSKWVKADTKNDKLRQLLRGKFYIADETKRAEEVGKLVKKSIYSGEAAGKSVKGVSDADLGRFTMLLAKSMAGYSKGAKKEYFTVTPSFMKFKNKKLEKIDTSKATLGDMVLTPGNVKALQPVVDSSYGASVEHSFGAFEEVDTYRRNVKVMETLIFTMYRHTLKKVVAEVLKGKEVITKDDHNKIMGIIKDKGLGHSMIGPYAKSLQGLTKWDKVQSELSGVKGDITNLDGYRDDLAKGVMVPDTEATSANRGAAVSASLEELIPEDNARATLIGIHGIDGYMNLISLHTMAALNVFDAGGYAANADHHGKYTNEYNGEGMLKSKDHSVIGNFVKRVNDMMKSLGSEVYAGQGKEEKVRRKDIIAEILQEFKDNPESLVGLYTGILTKEKGELVKEELSDVEAYVIANQQARKDNLNQPVKSVQSYIGAQELVEVPFSDALANEDIQALDDSVIEFLKALETMIPAAEAVIASKKEKISADRKERTGEVVEETEELSENDIKIYLEDIVDTETAVEAFNAGVSKEAITVYTSQNGIDVDLAQLSISEEEVVAEETPVEPTETSDKLTHAELKEMRNTEGLIAIVSTTKDKATGKVTDSNTVKKFNAGETLTRKVNLDGTYSTNTFPYKANQVVPVYSTKGEKLGEAKIVSVRALKGDSEYNQKTMKFVAVTPSNTPPKDDKKQKPKQKQTEEKKPQQPEAEEVKGYPEDMSEFNKEMNDVLLLAELAGLEIDPDADTEFTPQKAVELQKALYNAVKYPGKLTKSRLRKVIEKAGWLGNSEYVVSEERKARAIKHANKYGKGDTQTHFMLQMAEELDEVIEQDAIASDVFLDENMLELRAGLFKVLRFGEDIVNKSTGKTNKEQLVEILDKTNKEKGYDITLPETDTRAGYLALLEKHLNEIAEDVKLEEFEEESKTVSTEEAVEQEAPGANAETKEVDSEAMDDVFNSLPNPYYSKDSKDESQSIEESTLVESLEKFFERVIVEDGLGVVAEDGEVESTDAYADRLHDLLTFFTDTLKEMGSDLPITLETFKTEGITRGSVNIAKQYISLRGNHNDRRYLKSEVLAHEVFHLMTEQALRANKKLRRLIEDMQDEVISSFDYKVFLDSSKSPTSEEIKTAKGKWNYAVAGKDASEFLAYLATDKYLMENIGDHKITNRLIEPIVGEDIGRFSKLINKLIKVVNKSFAAYLEAMGSPSGTVSKATNETIVELVQLGISMRYDNIAATQEASGYFEKTVELTEKANAKVKGITDRMESTIKWIGDKGSDATKEGTFLTKISEWGILSKLKDTRVLSDTWFDFSKDTTKGQVGVFYDLYRDIKKTQEKDREDFKTNLKNVFNKNLEGLSDTEQAAVKRSLVDTDTGLLLSNGYTLPKIKKMLKDPALLDAIIETERQKLDALVSHGNTANAYHNQAKGLGYYMVNRLNKIPRQMHNAKNIYSGHWESSSRFNPKGSPAKTITSIDTLASLYAMKYLGQETKDIAVDGINANQDGILQTMSVFKNYMNETDAKLFDGATSFMVKGYTSPATGNSLKTIVLPESEVAYAVKWNKLKVIRELPEVGNRVEKRFLMSSRNYDIDRTKGAMEITNYNHSGLSFRDMARDDNMDTEVINKLIMKENAKSSSIMYSSKDIDLEASPIRMSPLLDMDGHIVDYRSEVSHQEKIDYLELDDNMADTLAGTITKSTSMATGIENNERLIKFLIEDAELNYHKDPSNYVKLSAWQSGSKTKATEMEQNWALIPQHTREYIRKQTGEQELLVRKDMLKDVMGYSSVSFRNLPFIKNSPKLERAVAMLETYWKEVVGRYKAIIVTLTGDVVLGNMISNMMTAMNLGIDPITFAKDTIEAWGDLDRYDVVNHQLEEAKIAYKGKKTKALEMKIHGLTKRLHANPAHKFIKAGLYTPIVEDINADRLLQKRHISRNLDNIKNKLKVGEKGSGVLDFLYMNERSMVFRKALKLTQFSDITSRMAIEKRKGLSMRELDQLFVNYSYNENKYTNFLNLMGVLLFTKYITRVPKAMYKVYKRNPMLTALMQGGQGVTGVDISDAYDNFYTPFDAVANRIQNPLDLFGEVMTPHIDNTIPTMGAIASF